MFKKKKKKKKRQKKKQQETFGRKGAAIYWESLLFSYDLFYLKHDVNKFLVHLFLDFSINKTIK